MDILPAELIYDIVQRLTPPDIRRLVKVSRNTAYIILSSKLYAQMTQCQCIEDDHRLTASIRFDNTNWVTYYLGRVEMDNNTIDNCMITAVLCGHSYLQQLFVEMGANDWTSGLFSAVSVGNLEAAEYFLNQ